MMNNWYVIYSKPKFEKKIVAACSRKKIESYFPTLTVGGESSKRSRSASAPLFESLVFIKAPMPEVEKIKKIDGVLSIMYWQDKPAVVPDTEISAIREFISQYDNIQVEPTVVNPRKDISHVSTVVKSAGENVYSENCKTIKMNLPSLGFALIAHADSDQGLIKRNFDFKTGLKSPLQSESLNAMHWPGRTL